MRYLMHLLNNPIFELGFCRLGFEFHCDQVIEGLDAALQKAVPKFAVFVRSNLTVLFNNITFRRLQSDENEAIDQLHSSRWKG